MKKRDLEFLFEIGTLRNQDRAWKQQLGMDVASDPEHCFRVAFLAMLLAEAEGVDSGEKILKMALVHDLAETRTGDFNYTQKVYVEADEARAAHDLFAGTAFAKLFTAELEEYERRESIEAKIVKDADNLDVDLELKELEERGSQLPKKWRATRKIVRDKKLYTASAKKFWDLVQRADVSSWHLKSNKWYKIPSAGK
jgi:putative hydrolase of HD superfamily